MDERGPVDVDAEVAEPVVNAGGRGLLRGVMRDEDGHVVISMAQEMRLTVIEP